MSKHNVHDLDLATQVHNVNDQVRVITTVSTRVIEGYQLTQQEIEEDLAGQIKALEPFTKEDDQFDLCLNDHPWLGDEYFSGNSAQDILDQVIQELENVGFVVIRS